MLMTPYYEDPVLTLYQGDVRDVLQEMPAESVHTVVTSPPYWSLRDYGIDPGVWGGDAECAHEWGEIQTQQRGGAYTGKTKWQHIAAEASADGVPVRTLNPEAWGLIDGHPAVESGAFCVCGAWRGALGLEPTPELFVEHMVEVFREVRRVLRKDGTCFLNVGDSYASSSTNPTPLLPRAPSYGSDGRERPDSPATGSAYRGLCDGCEGALSNRIAGTLPPRHEAAPHHEPKDRGSGHRGSALAPAGDGPLDAQASTIPEYAAPPLAECSHCSNCGACLSVLRSSSRDAQACVRRSQYTDDTLQRESAYRSQGKGASASAWGYSTTASLKPKDLVMIPFRLALALQADGWWVRQDIIWAKPNPMPESVTDRCTKSHEYMFLLTKAERYYYDADAIREKQDEAVRMAASFRDGGVYTNNRSYDNGANKDKATHGDGPMGSAGRNKRSVWTIPTAPFSDWTETVRKHPVQVDDVDDDTHCTPSVDCPLHAGWPDPAATALDDVREAARRPRSLGTNHPEQSRPSDSAAIALPLVPDPLLGNSGWPHLACSHSANGRSTENRRTGHARETNQPCTPCAQTETRRPRIQVLPGSADSAGRTPENNIGPVALGDLLSSETPCRIAHISCGPGCAWACRCTFYRETKESVSHFATFPPDLVKPCILAGTSEAGCCAECGAPWKRVTETSEEYREWAKTQRFYGEGGKGSAFREAKTNSATAPVKGTTTGWRASCKHESPAVPCTVLDPFMGSGTTGMVARSLGRHAVGIDLNPEYLAMAVERNTLTLPMAMGL